MIRTILAAVAVAALAPFAARAEGSDAVMAQFFATWDRDATVTPAAVDALYARRVVYYGRSLTNGQVYADKLAFTRRWPDRRYAVVPGTVAKSCDGGRTWCRVDATLAYRTRSDARGAIASGWTRVTLSLAREDGRLKVVREAGRPVAAP